MVKNKYVLFSNSQHKFAKHMPIICPNCRQNVSPDQKKIFSVFALRGEGSLYLMFETNYLQLLILISM